MKNVLKNSIRLLTVFMFFLAPFLLKAQSCSEYYPMDQGTKYEITHYDKNNKVESITRNEVISSSSQGNGMVATIHTVTTDNKGAETINAEYNISCDGDKVTIDMNSLLKEKIASSMKSQNSSVDAKVTGTNPVTPNNLEVGQTLPDTEMNMEFSSGAMNMKFSANSFNRKVVGKESITVPAGTFDCVVLTSETESKLLISKHTTTKIWLAKGVGIVQEEEYDKKGKLHSKQMLTSFSK